MADKQQNITINYKFNTTEVAAAESTLAKANAASNALQASAGKAGSAISQEFQKSKQTILDMQTALTRLKSIIEVTSDPKKLKQLSAEYKAIKTQMDEATKSAFKLETAIKSQGSAAQSASGGFGSLLTAAKAFVSLALVKQLASTTLEMAKLAGNAEGVQRAFERAFPNSFTILEQLRTATRGTVTDLELMQRTLQATNLGVAVEQLPVLFEFAAARAQQTGESVDYLVDSIVRGIGRKSPLILDNLGLSAVRLKEKFDGVALASVSVADVTKGVADIAREELAKMGWYVETGATKVAQLQTAWKQLTITFAQRLDSSGIINFFKEVFQGAENALKTDKQITEEITKMRAATEFASLTENQLAKERLINGKIVQTNSQELVNATQDEIRERFKLIESGKVELALLQQKYDAQVANQGPIARGLESNIKIRQEIGQQGVAIQKNIAFYQETIKLLKAYNTELNKPAATVDTGIIERKKEEIKTLQDLIEKSNNLADLGVGGRLTQKLEIAQAELGDLQRAFLDFKAIEFETEINNASKAMDNFDEASDRIQAQLKDIAENGVTLAVPPPTSVYEPDVWEKLKADFEDNWRDLTNIGIEIQGEQLKSLADTEVNNMKARLVALQDFYAEQQLLAGDNERAKEELRIREERETTKLRNIIARKEKQAAKNKILIDIAVGVAKAIATYIWPYWLIPAGIAIAQGAAQLAIVNRSPTNFAKGVIDLKGPGTGTSDSIPANLSRGESVMTNWETRVAGDVLRDVRAKKLDNKKLRELKQGRDPVKQQVFNDEKIIKAIKEQKFPDVIKDANMIYESREYNDNYRKRIRSSSMSI